MAGYWKYSNKTPAPFYICIGLVDSVLRTKILGNRLGILTYILITMDYYFFVFVFQRSTFNLEKTKAFVKENFWFIPSSNRIYLLRKCFSNYVYLKDMYIKLKGVGKLLSVSLLTILLICKFINITAIFTKNFFKVFKVCIQLSV